MSALTIHQVGDFGWFSERKTASSKYSSVVSALKAHIRYVESKATAVFNSASNILAKAKEELQKRWDSRIALKFWIAVPKDWRQKEALENVVAFVSKQLNVPLENISAFYHAHPNNPHIHLLIYPRDVNGKKLRLGKKELQEFHRAWDRLLQEMGYEIKRYKDGVQLKRLNLKEQEIVKLPNIPRWLLYKDADLKMLYEEYVSLRNEVVAELKQFDEDLAMNKAEEFSDKEVEKAFRMEKAKSILRFWDKKQKDFKEKQKYFVELQTKALGLKPQDKVAIVLVGDGKKPLQRILSVEKLLSDKFLAFLRAKNSEGYNIYISVNKLKPTARKRTKDAFEEKQRTIYLDIDGDKLGVDGFEILKRIIREQNLPMPTLLIRTSKHNYQAVWTLSEERPAQQLEAVMKNLAEKYSLDHTQDISRVFRLAGFYNRKKGKGNLVYIAQGSTLEQVNFEPFKKLLPELEAVERKRKEERQILDTAKQKFRYSITLDQYEKALSKVLSSLNNRYLEILEQTYPGTKEEIADDILSEFHDLAIQIVRHRKRFKSASEFELALAHRIDKALKLHIGNDKHARERLLLEIFEKLLKEVRPHKLERNPKYPLITISKVLKAYPSHTPSAGAERPRVRVNDYIEQVISELKNTAQSRGYDWELFEYVCREYLGETISEKLGLRLKWKPLNLKALINLYAEKLGYQDLPADTLASLIFKEANVSYKALMREREQRKSEKKFRLKHKQHLIDLDAPQSNRRKKKKGKGFSPGM